MCEVTMKKVRVLAVFLVFLLLAGCGNKVNFGSHSTVPADDDNSPDPADSGESADSGDPEDPDFYDSVDTDIELPLPGNPVYFGTYEQDKDILNGKEPIEWRFLKVERFRAFLLSEYGLDAYRFDENYTGWRGSDIQSWLNEYFYTEAFSDGERAKILETKTSLSVNSAYNSYSYIADKIFLLKRSEIEQYFGEKCDRLVYPTPYANAKGALMTVSESCSEAGAAAKQERQAPGGSIRKEIILIRNMLTAMERLSWKTPADPIFRCVRRCGSNTVRTTLSDVTEA